MSQFDPFSDQFGESEELVREVLTPRTFKARRPYAERWSERLTDAANSRQYLCVSHIPKSLGFSAEIVDQTLVIRPESASRTQKLKDILRRNSYDRFRQPNTSDLAVEHVYREAFSMIERLHRQFLDVLRSELDRLGVDDINNVQGLILFNIGTDELTVGELTARGYYLGTNVTYNLKKLVEYGYVQQERSPRDRRSVRVRLSDKGRELAEQLKTLFTNHARALGDGVMSTEDLEAMIKNLRTLEQFWTRAASQPGFLQSSTQAA